MRQRVPAIFLVAAFGSCLVGCPSGSGPDTLPACNPAHGNTDCSGHDDLKYCIPLGGPSSGRCIACRDARDCDDGNPCNGSETCDGFLGCGAGAPITCPSCFSCQPATGSCRADARMDTDGDGEPSISCGGTDCDDHDAARSPSRTEVCDAHDVDEDCDPSTFGKRDVDGDGHSDATCRNVEGTRIHAGDDCDDHNPGAHTGLAEACDGRDNDCDGAIDEGVLAIVYTDVDGDGWGVGMPKMICSGADGFAFQPGDCDDDRANLHPGAFRCAGGGSGIDVCGDDGTWSESSCPGDGQCVAQPDGTGVCWPGTLSECTDGVDNDGDALVDSSDPDCASPADTSESAGRCNDGIDNDGDLLVDYPNDPGCSSRFDTSEADPATASACSNGLDDDGDGTADYAMGTGDPGCSSAADDSERDPSGAHCDNGVDDDENSFTDYPDDPNCSGPLDDNEGLPACMNGVDDDGDGLTDYIAASNYSDPGCTDAKDDSERGAPVCDNGVDDDGDGAVDYPGDVGCLGPGDGTE